MFPSDCRAASSRFKSHLVADAQLAATLWDRSEKICELENKSHLVGDSQLAATLWDRSEKICKLGNMDSNSNRM